MMSAFDRLRAEAVAEGGGFIIAPDSADPWPSEIWERVDLEVVAENISKYKDEVAVASPEDINTGTAGSGLYFTPHERALLEQLGEISVEFQPKSS